MKSMKLVLTLALTFFGLAQTAQAGGWLKKYWKEDVAVLCPPIGIPLLVVDRGLELERQRKEDKERDAARERETERRLHEAEAEKLQLAQQLNEAKENLKQQAEELHKLGKLRSLNEQEKSDLDFVAEEFKTCLKSTSSLQAIHVCYESYKKSINN